MTNRTFPNKFPGTCITCGRKVPAQAGVTFKADGGWRVTCAPGQCSTDPVPAVAVAEAPAEFDPTPEQAAIVTAAESGAVLCIEAFAGAGKTATLRLVAKALRSKQIVYTAFNKAIVEDGAGKFGQNVTVSTFHSLALRSLPADLKGFYLKANSRPRMNYGELSSVIRAESWQCQTPNGRYEVPRTRMAEWAAATVIKWLSGDFATIEDRHAFRAEGIREIVDAGDSADGDGPNWLDLRSKIAGAARRLWADLSDPARSEAMTKQFSHASYLKTFSLADRALPCDVLLVDEAQDLDPVMLRIIDNSARAGVQVILVGDSNQQIYEWRGAVNALASFSARPGVVTLRLTQSFRFGPEIAGQAQVMLSELGCPASIIGAGKPGAVGPIADPVAVLCRTNAAVVRYALDGIMDGKRVGVVGGVTEIVRFAEACRDLQAGRRTNHPDLAAFETWAQVETYTDTEGGSDLKLLVDLIKKLGVETVINDLARCGSHTTPNMDVIVGTAHKTKGLEWLSVQLGSDWKRWDAENEYSAAELRVLYVACTRAKKLLDTGGVFAKPDPKPATAPVPPADKDDDLPIAPWQPLGDLAG